MRSANFADSGITGCTITAADKLACAERELRLRRRNYHRYLATGRISVRKASYELAVMRAIVEDYRAAAEKERLL